VLRKQQRGQGFQTLVGSPAPLVGRCCNRDSVFESPRFAKPGYLTFLLGFNCHSAKLSYHQECLARFVADHAKITWTDKNVTLSAECQSYLKIHDLHHSFRIGTLVAFDERESHKPPDI